MQRVMLSSVLAPVCADSGVGSIDGVVTTTVLHETSMSRWPFTLTMAGGDAGGVGGGGAP